MRSSMNAREFGRRISGQCSRSARASPRSSSRTTHNARNADPMAEEPDGLRRHFILDGVTETEPYRNPGSGGDGAPNLHHRIDPSTVRRCNARSARFEAWPKSPGKRNRLPEGKTDWACRWSSRASPKSSSPSKAWHESDRALSSSTFVTRTTGPTPTVFVPDGKLDHFERLIREYLEEARDRAGRARDHSDWLTQSDRFGRRVCGRSGPTPPTNFLRPTRESWPEPRRPGMVDWSTGPSRGLAARRHLAGYRSGLGEPRRHRRLPPRPDGGGPNP